MFNKCISKLILSKPLFSLLRYKCLHSHAPPHAQFTLIESFVTHFMSALINYSYSPKSYSTQYLLTFIGLFYGTTIIENCPPSCGITI